MVTAKHAPVARLLNSLSMQADQERKTLPRMTDWAQRNPDNENRSTNRRSFSINQVSHYIGASR